MTHKIIAFISLSCISISIWASEPADDELDQEIISTMEAYAQSQQTKIAEAAATPPPKKIIFKLSSSSAFQKPQPQSAFIVSAGAASAAQVVAPVSAAASAVPQTDLKQSAETQPLTPNQALPAHLGQWLYEPVDGLATLPQQHEELLQMFRISYIQQTVLTSQQAQAEPSQAALKAGKAVSKAKTAAPQGYTKEYSLF